MAHLPFSGTIPDDRLYCPRYDMWVQRLENGDVRVGATAFGVFLAGAIVAFTSKPKGASVDRGRGLGTVESRKAVQAVHAPLSLTGLEGNEAAEERPLLINDDPFGAGWMVRGQPVRWEEEKAALVDAARYREHILRCEPEARLG